MNRSARTTLRLLATGLWRFHRKALVIGLGGLLALAGALVAISGGCPTAQPSCGNATALDGEVPNRVVLDRAWFSSLPETERDVFEAWVFTSDGIGIHHSGSVYRQSIDWFTFERAGANIALTFLQDEHVAATDYRVSRCSDNPPFDLCLELDDAPRGPSRLYGFSDQESYELHAPSAARLRVAATAAP